MEGFSVFAFNDHTWTVYAGATIGGDSELDAVPTTAHVDLIESGEGEMTFAAEIHLRSL